jgi:hypothetical protein
MDKKGSSGREMSIEELELALRKARERQAETIKSDAKLPDRLEADDAVLRAERELAAAKAEPYAVEIPLPVRWDGGSPLPHLLQNEHRTFLIFFLQEAVREYPPPAHQRIAVVEFVGCVCAKLGSPNDEVFHGHPLYGRGFAFYGAMKVENSEWLKEIVAMNAVHDRYSPDAWKSVTHYVLAFHDSTSSPLIPSRNVRDGFCASAWVVCQRLTQYVSSSNV